MGCSITASAESRLGAWRWGAVLAFALFAPVALPAGGADRRQPEVRRRTTG
ncbi:MAG: SH3 domain-containing protein, partial [Gammaproteobacteria bacterium]|nr:SH3 domain-containing protein [Gammaproteobacteria bacterium]